MRAEAQQRFLAALAANIQHLADPGETIAAVARLLAEHLGVERCAYAESDGEESFCVVGDHSRGVPSIVGRYAFADFGAEFARLTRADGPYVVVDAETDLRIEPAVRAACRQTTFRAVVSVSFHQQGRFVGGMAVHQTRPRAWRDDEAALVRLVAARGWDLIERARAVRRLQESEARCRAAAEALKEASKRKDEFLATLAHELRKSLAPIRNGLAVLRADAGAAPGAAERGGGNAPPVLVAMMDRQLSQLVHLVDDLLDVSRVTTGKIQLPPERVALREIVDAAVEMCRPGVETGRHELSVELPPDPLVLEADRTRVTQVLSNLLHNACKYTPNGGRIGLAAEREGGRVVVRVTDTGIGIPADMLPHVFELFTQVGRSIDRAQGGPGIGVSLVKKLVEMRGGEVTASSGGAGAGSTFAVRLPLAADAPRAGAAAERPNVARGASGRWPRGPRTAPAAGAARQPGPRQQPPRFAYFRAGQLPLASNVVPSQPQYGRKSLVHRTLGRHVHALSQPSSPVQSSPGPHSALEAHAFAAAAWPAAPAGEAAVPSADDSSAVVAPPAPSAGGVCGVGPEPQASARAEASAAIGRRDQRFERMGRSKPPPRAGGKRAWAGRAGAGVLRSRLARDAGAPRPSIGRPRGHGAMYAGRGGGYVRSR